MRQLLILSSLLISISGVAQSQLVIEVELNKPTAGGTVRMALCPSVKAYKSEKGCRVVSGVAKGNIVHILVDDMPEGRYAIKAFHDVNDSGTMEFNITGMPKEPYGFSNNASGFMGAPKFEDAAFTVKKGKNVTRFKMRG